MPASFALQLCGLFVHDDEYIDNDDEDSKYHSSADPINRFHHTKYLPKIRWLCHHADLPALWQIVRPVALQTVCYLT